MPSSIPIAMLVLGAVLFLLALLGAPFKLLSNELPALTHTGARWIAGLTGFILIAFGAYLALRNADVVVDRRASPSPGTSSSGADANSSLAPGKQDSTAATTSDSTTTTPGPVPVQTAAPFSPASEQPCVSGTGEALAQDRIDNVRVLHWKPPFTTVGVNYQYDSDAHHEPVYLRVRAYFTGQVIASGFARLAAPTGAAEVSVQTTSTEALQSDFVEAVLCTEGARSPGRTAADKVHLAALA